MPGVGRFVLATDMKNLIIQVAVLLSAVLLSGCLDLASDASRDVNVFANTPSPNQSYVATSYSMMGGGAAGWCYVYVNVRKQSEQFNPEDGVIFGTRCDVGPELKWQGEKRLSIEYPRDATVYTQKKTWGSGEAVEISYVPK